MVEVDNGPVSDFMPVEVGIVEWCMREGITGTLHKFINPGAALLVQMNLLLLVITTLSNFII
jgi:piRNA pathway germ-plasm component